jgi:hypothetical protein
VHVGIAGQHIKTLQHRGQLVREYSDSEISQKDIDRLVHDIHKLVLPPGDKILHASAFFIFAALFHFAWPHSFWLHVFLRFEYVY